MELRLLQELVGDQRDPPGPQVYLYFYDPSVVHRLLLVVLAVLQVVLVEQPVVLVLQRLEKPWVLPSVSPLVRRLRL